MKKIIQTLALLLPTAVMAQHWTAKTTYDLPNETNVYVQLMVNGHEVSPNDAAEMAAFIDDDCRADATEMTYISNSNEAKAWFTLRVVGDQKTELNKDISFRVYLHGIEYAFTTKIPFTGETYTPSPLVLNLDAISGVSIPETIEITQPATAFPYTMDLSPYITFLYEYYDDSSYTPKGESEVVSPIQYQWRARSNYLLFDGNSVTVSEAQQISADANLHVYFGESQDAGDPVNFTARTQFVVSIATVPVTSISCSLTDLEVYAYEDITPYFEGKVTIKPDDATNKEYYFRSGNDLSDNKFIRGGKFTLNIYPRDGNYTGQPVNVNVTSWMRPSSINTTAPNNFIFVGIGENVYDAIQAYQELRYPVNNPGDYVKDDVSYTFGETGFVDNNGKALKEGRVNVTVKLVNGITPVQTYNGNDSYSLTVVIESQLEMRVEFGATEFVKNGSISTDSPAFVYVSNPGNEPFDPNDLTIQFNERYDGYPYAIQTSVAKGGDNTEEGETGYRFYIKPLFIGEEVSFRVFYKGEVLEDDSWVSITNEQNLAAGWNWMSLTSVQSSDGMSVEDVFTQSDIIEIRSQQALLYNDPTYGYFGELSMLRPTEATYKVKTKKATVAVLGGITAFDCGETYAMVKPGYNWMNNPYEFDIPVSRISEFLYGSPNAPFTPVEGDMIITREAFAIYSGGEWTADDSFALKQGEGLVYYSKSSDEKPIYFDAILQPSFDINGVKAIRTDLLKAPQREVFQYDSHAFADNMAMVAVVDALDNPQDYTLGVFVNGECRGRGKVVRGNIMFVNAVGQVGERLTFRLMNNATGEVSMLDDVLTYSLVKGSIDSPVVLGASSVTGISRTAESQQQENAVYDLSGRRVERMQKGIYIINGKKVLK